MSDDETARGGGSRDAAVQAEVVRMRESGASWLQIQARFSLSRQEARYAYQVGMRDRRRHGSRPEDAE
jgi:hypothetical protein